MSIANIGKSTKSWEKKLAMKVAKKLEKKSDTFVWLKKIERDVKQGRVENLLNAKSLEKKRHKDRIAEIDKLKKKRDERAAAKARREEEAMMLQRHRVRAEADVYEKNECEFVLDQFKTKSRIRFYQGRAKSIDILTLIYDDDYDFDVGHDEVLDEPCMVLEGLMVRDVEELRGEIDLRLECLCRIIIDNGDHRRMVEFWEALMVVCDWEVAEKKRKEVVGGGRGGVHSSIEADVKNFLQTIKSYNELIALQAQIGSDMRLGKAKVVEFWEEVLRQIHVYKARAFLKEFHGKRNLHKNSKPKSSISEKKDISERESNKQEDYKDDYDRALSPPLMECDGDDTKHERVIDAAVDRLEQENFEAKVRKVMGRDLEEGEAVLGPSAEVKLVDSSTWNWWHDIYRPRKPKYLIKYHTGYVWNQYNRTHYDKENPPPKFIQGYKFNIFYPHLIDQTKTLQCFTEEDLDSNDDTLILRFHAGPPYEDIAFRIDSKDWEYSPKKGYKCTFEGGILRLYFNFKRLYYIR